jgi:hypothetical protein
MSKKVTVQMLSKCQYRKTNVNVNFQNTDAHGGNSKTAVALKMR